MAAKKNEVKWVKEKAIPLLRRLGYRRVDFLHGTLEAGRDIVMADYDRFGLIHYFVVQAKDGDLRAKSQTQEVNTIYDQLRTAYETPYRDPSSGTEHKITGAYLVVNGTVTDAARNILYSKTGGWLSVVDLSQLEIAALLARNISDEERRVSLFAVSNEFLSNQNSVEDLKSLYIDKSEQSESMPHFMFRSRALAKYIDIGYLELHTNDIVRLDVLADQCDILNNIVSKLPFGPLSETDTRMLGALHAALYVYESQLHQAQDGLEQLLKAERPPPGRRFSQCFFLELESQDNGQSD